jgi:hypothetical protein
MVRNSVNLRGYADFICNPAPIHLLNRGALPMPRNNVGQFQPGTCGNPRGRPRKLPRKISAEQLRSDFFEAGEMLLPIIENRERKLVPANVAIDKQLAIKAASGDLRAIIEWNKKRQRLTLEYIKNQLSLLETLIKSEDIERKFPEDVTEEFKALTRGLRLSIDPDFLP